MLSRTFHRGIASGVGFCNRVIELDRILKNIQKTTHTLLISPRRYGKTSLALRAIEQTKLSYAHIDLFLKTDENTILDEFFNGISHLLSQILKPSESALKKVESFLKNINISIKFGKLGFEFSLLPKLPDKKINLKQLLINLDELLAKQNTKAIIFIDELQAMIETDVCAEIESALRFVAQKTKHICFIFSGSHRHLLEKIFDDHRRPLYKLCHQMSIEKISATHYKSFINKFAKLAWSRQMPENVMSLLLDCTKLHPYYVNILCSYLFELPHLPQDEDIKVIWEKICFEEQSSVAKDIEFLTPKQKQLLSAIALHPQLKEPTAKNFLQKVNLTAKGVVGALAILQKHDVIEKLSSGEIRIVDPVLEHWAK